MNRMLFKMLLVTALAVVAMPAIGQSRAAFEAQWATDALVAGEEADLVLMVFVQPGWHVQAGAGSGDSSPDQFATQITASLPDGWSLNSIHWPASVPFVVGEGQFALTGNGYEGQTAIVLRIAVPASTAAGEYDVTLTTTYQACDYATCEMPVTVETATTARVVEAGDRVSEALDEVERSLYEATIAKTLGAGEAVEETGAFNVEFDGQTRLKAELVWRNAIVPGQEAELGVLMHIEPHWHIQAGEGSGDTSEDQAPTEIRATLPDGWEVIETLWPESTEFVVGEGEFALSGKGYKDHALAVLRIAVPESAALGEHAVDLALTYQACDDMQCEPPAEISVSGSAIVVSPSDATAPSHHPDVAAMFDAVLNHGRVASAPQRSADEVDVAEVLRPQFFGIEIPRPDGALGLLLLALLAMVGGFILNLTPCVLPVIPIKILTISQHAGVEGRSLILGIWMALGVVAFWIAIGLPVAFVAGITDPSRIFGIWWLTLGIGLVIGAMGIGIMGMFTIELPKAAYAVNPKADTPAGSFMFGVMTGVLGLPCFGFIAGALLAGAATLPPVTVITIFTSIGIGMASPYLVLAWKPKLVDRIPRTGPASELVKQVMGLFLLAAAAWFIGSGLVALVSDHPYLGRQLHWWAAAILLVFACLWLIIRTFQISTKPAPRIIWTVAGVAISAVAILYANDSTSKARVDWEALAGTAGGGFVAGAWNRYTETSFEEARAAGKVVVLDFTAEWCLICKSLKAAVLNREPVKSELAKQDVVSFTVDLTSLNDPGWDFLYELGQTGIPLLVIYSPGENEPWQANAYTSPQVMSALERARATELAQR